MTGKTRSSQGSYLPMQTIPAAPGYFVITHVCDVDETDKVIEYALDEIIGWALDRDTLQPYPITLYGVDDNAPAILKPSGKIDRLGMESYDSIAQWLKDLRHTKGVRF